MLNIQTEDMEHVINVRIVNLEKWVAKIDNRLWTVITILLINLMGVIGILITSAR